MANYCSVRMPDGWGTGTNTVQCPTATYSAAAMWTAAGSFQCDGVWNPAAILAPMRTAQTTPWTFDADHYAIDCAAFPDTAGGADPVINQAAAINILNTSVASLQSQMTALSAGSITQAPNPEIIEASALIFGAFLVAGAAVWGLKRIYRLLATDGGIDG